MAKDKKKRPKKQLTGLAAALVKSGHLKEKKAREIKRVERKEEKALGREGLAQREAEKLAADEARRAAEAEAARVREQERAASGEAGRLQRVVRDRMVQGIHGARRFFFVARDGRVPYLDLDRDVAHGLIDGKLGIAESLGAVAAEHVVLEVAGVNTLYASDPELVRFWNKAGRPPRPERD